MNDADDAGDDELTAAERAALTGLRRTEPIPAGFEDRVIEAVTGAAGGRAVTRPSRPRGRTLLAVAASLAWLTIGFALGRARPSTPPPALGERYLLLLRESAAFRPSEPRAALVGEYRAWAQSLAHRGQLELGEELAEDGRLLGAPAAGAGAPTADGGTVAGLFIVRADSLAGALALAASCPHLRHGGRIELRRIVDTGTS